MSPLHYSFDFVARSPRHIVADEHQVQVSLLEPAKGSGTAIKGEIIDFSRHGVCLTVPSDAQVPAQTVLRLFNPDVSLDVHIPCHLRWCRPDAESNGAMVGCAFDQELSFETFGELFLAGLLQGVEESDDDLLGQADEVRGEAEDRDENTGQAE